VSSALLKRGAELLRIDKSVSNDACSRDYYRADIRNVLVDDKDLMKVVQGSSCLVHCAGLAHKVPRNEVEEREFFDVNSTGTRNVVELCGATRISRIVYISTISVYDWASLQMQADEESALLLDTAYAESKFQGERFVQESSLDWRISRLATVYGTGDRANFWKLASALKRRRFVLPGNGSARKSVLPVTVAGELVGRMAMEEEISHRLLNLALPEAPSLKQIVQAFCEECGFKSPIRVPMWVLTIMALCGDVAERIVEEVPLTSGTLRKLAQDTVVSTKRMEENFGKIEYPGFAETLGEFSAYYRG
jgi:UDP-glucose 4-epimerase